MIALPPLVAQAAVPTPANLPGPTTPAALPEPTAPIPTPPPEDVRKFEAAFAPPRVVIKGLDATPPPEIQPAIATPGALGDKVLASVERMRAGYQEGLTRIDTAMHKVNLTMPDMMSMLVDSMKMSLQQDMLSKMVGRSTQNLDTLLKGQ